MFTKEFEDGTEFTAVHFAAALAIGTIGGSLVFAAKSKWDRFTTKRYMKKHSWPQKAIDRM